MSLGFHLLTHITVSISINNEIKELTIVTCTNKGKDRLIVKAQILEAEKDK